MCILRELGREGGGEGEGEGEGERERVRGVCEEVTYRGYGGNKKIWRSIIKSAIQTVNIP